jgi:hypothetical protein
MLHKKGLVERLAKVLKQKSLSTRVERLKSHEKNEL